MPLREKRHMLYMHFFVIDCVCFFLIVLVVSAEYANFVIT